MFLTIYQNFNKSEGTYIQRNFCSKWMHVLMPIFSNFTMWFVNLIQIPIKVNMFFQSVWQSCIVYCKYNLAPWETKRIHMIWGWCPDQRLFQLVQGLCKLFHGHSNLCRQLKRKPNKFASNKVTNIWLNSEEIPIFHIILLYVTPSILSY